MFNNNSRLSSQSGDKDTPLHLSSQSVYPTDNDFYGYQNLTGQSLQNFEDHFPRAANHIPESVNYSGLVDYKSDYGVFKFREAEM